MIHSERVSKILTKAARTVATFALFHYLSDQVVIADFHVCAVFPERLALLHEEI